VYAGCGDGVQVWDSEGTLIGKVALGSTCANFCFIRDGLWIGNEKCMYFARLSAKGALAEIECD
jgi:gluconolactonase